MAESKSTSTEQRQTGTGLAGLLVRTGKYRLGDEARITPPPSAVLADLSEAVDWILKRARIIRAAPG